MAARLRGVRVRPVREQDYLRERKARANPFEVGGSLKDNRELFAAMLRASIDARAD